MQMYNPTNPKHRRMVDALKAKFPDRSTVTRQEITAMVNASTGPNDILEYPNWLTNNPIYRVPGVKGEYYIPGHEPNAGSAATVSETAGEATSVMEAKTVSAPAAPAQSNMPEPKESPPELIPAVSLTYVPFGHHKNIKQIVASKKFYPTFVTGLSGNGKTTMIEQVCAQLKRAFYRVNITAETDEDDLLGGFRLVNGATVFEYGPVVQAMLTGGILLLDEVDLGSSKLMCLQPVMEGKGVFLKKTKEWIFPAKGFNVFATANTKGKGDDTGNFIGTGVMNEAQLDRFDITYEQDYPPASTEIKILTGILAQEGIDKPEFVNHLVAWAEDIRKAYLAGSISDIITTRRLVAICKNYCIFRNEETAVRDSLNRFPADSKQAMYTVFKSIDPSKRNAKDPSAPKPVDPSKIVYK